MKDPLLTPFFPDLHRLYPAEAWFVVVVRHPFEVVRSRQEVHDKSGLARPFGVADAMAVAQEYLSFYNTIMAQSFSGRLFMFRYEDLQSDAIQTGLAQFIGVDDLDPEPDVGRGAAARRRRLELAQILQGHRPGAAAGRAGPRPGAGGGGDLRAGDAALRIQLRPGHTPSAGLMARPATKSAKRATSRSRIAT